jgi:acyl-CoA thioesterase FadM
MRLNYRTNRRIEQMKHMTFFNIQPYDTDFGGVVSNTTYVRWIEQLRTGWLDSLMPRSRQQAEALTLLVGRVEIDYLHPVGLYDGDGQIAGVIEDVERGHTRVVFQARFRVGDEDVACAVQKTLLVNMATRRAARFPADVAERLDGTTTAEVGMERG